VTRSNDCTRHGSGYFREGSTASHLTDTNENKQKRDINILNNEHENRNLKDKLSGLDASYSYKMKCTHSTVVKTTQA